MTGMPAGSNSHDNYFSQGSLEASFNEPTYNTKRMTLYGNFEWSSRISGCGYWVVVVLVELVGVVTELW